MVRTGILRATPKAAPAKGAAAKGVGRQPGEDDVRFARLGRPRRIWVVAAIRAETQRLVRLHDQLEMRLQPGDRLVYTGDHLGHGADPVGTVQELLAFRRAVLARAGWLAGDVVYLRGAMEEMWQKLLQLQFAPNPRDVLAWMLARGLGTTLAAYGSSVAEAQSMVRAGAAQIGRWTQTLRDAQRLCPGHDRLMAALRRAAFSHDLSEAKGDAPGLLIVSAGLDPTRPLAAQGDGFWWDVRGFSQLGTAPFAGAIRVIRGSDHQGGGVIEGPHAVSLDAGCGFGGPLTAACFLPDGRLVEPIQV